MNFLNIEKLEHYIVMYMPEQKSYFIVNLYKTVSIFSAFLEFS